MELRKRRGLGCMQMNTFIRTIKCIFGSALLVVSMQLAFICAGDQPECKSWVALTEN